jgi:hypothetical protein
MQLAPETENPYLCDTRGQPGFVLPGLPKEASLPTASSAVEAR